ncbi:MAG: AmmeMemoRadiSam system protein B [Planctomycetes bacterium]|nr:AmmeMemoRadiSam system protein B [Planctomycetota bacterium]
MTTDNPGQNPTGGPAGQPTPPQLPPFHPEWTHHSKPKIRALRGFAAQIGEQQALGLADAKQITDRIVVTAPAMQVVLPLMNGERTVEQICAEVGRGLTPQILGQFVVQLDESGLLFGPKFDEIMSKMKTDFDSSPILPPATTATFVDSLVMQEVAREMNLPAKPPEDQAEAQRLQRAVQERAAALPEARKDEIGGTKLREIFDAWISKALENAESPSFNELPKGIVAPHIDYARGWINYASVWGRMRVTDRPDRIVVLGTNHFGDSTGVCGCDKGYRTVLGTCDLDEKLLATLKEKLGASNANLLLANRFDHEREHSVELQIPWIQHCIGRDEAGNFPKVFAALIHDPAVNNGESYDGKGLALQPFIDALRATISSLPGKTLIVSSADLSHVGPAFGDQQGPAGDTKEAAEFRNKTFAHDKDMLEIFRTIRPDDLVASMAWQQNPTRWCSTGNLVAALKTVQPERVEMLNYSAAVDNSGAGMVSSISAAMF